MHNLNLSNSEAYDAARKEFYALRHEEEVERQVAREEAFWTGAYFGKGQLEVGMELEDRTYEQWKEWATKEVETIERQRDAAYTSIGTGEDAEDADADVEEPALV